MMSTRIVGSKLPMVTTSKADRWVEVNSIRSVVRLRAKTIVPNLVPS